MTLAPPHVYHLHLDGGRATDDQSSTQMLGQVIRVLTVKCSSSWALKVLKAVEMPVVRSDFGSTPETETGSSASSV